MTVLALAGDRLLTGVASARQRLEDALRTPRGSWPWMRDYGSSMPALLDRALTPAGRSALAASVAEAVAWPPNGLADVELQEVRVTAAGGGVVEIDVAADWIPAADAGDTPLGQRGKIDGKLAAGLPFTVGFDLGYLS